MVPKIKVGTTTGTGAAINVSVGFVPDYIEVANATTGTVIDRWYAGMAQGTSINGTTLRATNGLSTYAGSTTAGAGFTIGSAVSTNGATLAFRCSSSGS
jgi:hypothetical protein